MAKSAAYEATIARRKAGGRTAGVLVTGDKELDAKLRKLTPRLHDKLVKKALKISGKDVLTAFKAFVKAEAYDTGAYMRAASVKPRKKRKGQLGVQIHIDKNKMLAHRLKKTGGTELKKQKDIIAAHGDSFKKQFFYPAALEFGRTLKDGTRVEGVRAQRRALYDNEEKVTQQFISSLRELVRET